ncbi:anaerobic sulfite reductase subunit AsrA [Clostridium sp. D2Q-14]|uniref:anaerobic sulfite reductase subunit AsrA n=1 Tax=Anaeromonas gelatinilytica TaxID=2683194 RepID=UPI00193BFEA3|nr:anaerobic sulfite reductase subunit AsrA [Anaeromonas gelatinilytica]MBS4534286.1 anaerobic sulfite reductase subunit AsrA [Anaeromonas gelatinilytica]
MKIEISKEDFNKSLHRLGDEYRIYAPVAMAYKGTFSDTDSIRYKEINTLDEIEFNLKSHFSPKEVILPITQVLFYFTEDQYKEPETEKKKLLVFLRACDIHAVKRMDQIYLENGQRDPYYQEVRDTVKFVLIGCEKSYRNCFCVSMGTNKTEDYSLGIKPVGDQVLLDIKDEELNAYFFGEEKDFEMNYVTSNDIKVLIPEPHQIAKDIAEAPLWREYDERCVACGKCNFVCSTCTCFRMQDIFYKDNENNGERRRVWASCQVDGYTDMAGGHSFRKRHGDRMRYKVLHKVYDYNKRFGYHMCVGCGRCDDACPQYISFSTCVNKLHDLGKEER